MARFTSNAITLSDGTVCSTTIPQLFQYIFDLERSKVKSGSNTRKCRNRFWPQLRRGWSNLLQVRPKCSSSGADMPVVPHTAYYFLYTVNVVHPDFNWNCAPGPGWCTFAPDPVLESYHFPNHSGAYVRKPKLRQMSSYIDFCEARVAYVM